MGRTVRRGGKESKDRAVHFGEKKKIDLAGPLFDLLCSRETGISRKERPVFREEKPVSRKELLCLVRNIYT